MVTLNEQTENEQTEEKLDSQEVQEDFAKLYEDSLMMIKEGQVLPGTIVSISKKDVIVDIGYKAEGIVAISEFADAKDLLKIGSELKVYVEKRYDSDGMVVLSKNKAEKLFGWESIVANCGEGTTIKGQVLKKVKGGLMVDIGGVEAFLPGSLVFLKGFGNVDELLGRHMNFKIVKINHMRRNIVLSRKEILQEEYHQVKDKFLTELEKGQMRQGTVKNITDFGAFVDLGGVDGLLHINDMSWGRISHPSQMVAIGDKIDVMILDFNKDTMRISLGLKQKTESPWKEAEEKYAVGLKVKGKVVNLLPYGAFIELEKGIEGLVHVSEFSWTKRINHPKDVLVAGDMVEAIVLSIDAEQEKISLGIKQVELNPWLEVEKKYPVGIKVKGNVTGIMDYGVFVEFEDGIEGLLHIKDMSWTRKVGNPSELFNKGDEAEVVVLSVDGANKRLLLGFKQLSEDPWDKISKDYPAGVMIEGKVMKVTNFGIFILLDEELEGLVHISEIDRIGPVRIEDIYKEGDTVKVRVLNVDPEQKRIALSMK